MYFTICLPLNLFVFISYLYLFVYAANGFNCVGDAYTTSLTMLNDCIMWYQHGNLCVKSVGVVGLC